MGSYGFRLRVAGESAHACVPRTPKLDDMLRAYGYNPADFGWVHYPVGLSQIGRGRVLLGKAALDALQADGGASSMGAVEVLIGDSDQADGHVRLQSWYVARVRPIFVSDSELGQLYALDLEDERARLADTVGATAVAYNLRGAGRTTWVAGTIASGDEVTGTPHSFDDVLGFIEGQLGITLTIDDAGPSASVYPPIDVRAAGAPLVEWVDLLCALSGRVCIWDADGGGATIEDVDARNVFDVLGAMNRIGCGGAMYDPDAGGTAPPTDLLANSAPVVFWAADAIPATVAIAHPTMPSTASLALDTPAWAYYTASYDAASANLPNEGAQGEAVIYDNAYVHSVAGTLDRDEAIAARYYRRFVAGAAHVKLAGAQMPTLGASCQSVTWRQGPDSMFTEVRAELDWDGYAWQRKPATPIRSGPRIDAVPLADGSVEVRNNDAYIFGDVVASEFDEDEQPIYTVNVPGYGDYADMSPQRRPWGPDVSSIAADIGTKAMLRTTGAFVANGGGQQTGLALVMPEAERFQTELCDESAVALIDEEFEDGILVGVSGRPLVGVSGRVLFAVSAGYYHASAVGDSILTSVGGDIIVGVGDA